MSRKAFVCGSGHTKWIGSREIAFAAAEGIQERMKAELAIAWPFLLDDRVRLQLSVEAIVTRIASGVVEARIVQHHFRTRGEWGMAEDPAPASVGVPPEAVSAALCVQASGAAAHI